MDYQLLQRGRAVLDFEVAARQAANGLHRNAIAILAKKGLTADTLPDGMNDRHDAIDAALADSPTYAIRGLLGEWCARHHGLAAREAFEEIRDEIVPRLKALEDGPVTLEELPHYDAPRYHSQTWFHRTHGGWDASEYNGFVHGELIAQRYLRPLFPVGNYTALLDLATAPAVDLPAPTRILEFGTASGPFTQALAETYPDAQIDGIDPSRRMLEQARRRGNELGHAWKLHVGVMEDTRFPDDTFDLITSYAVAHELPPRIIRTIIAESLRLLRPGGMLVIADVPRYADIDKIMSWTFDWTARYHGEPFWRASAEMDFSAEAIAAGFSDARTETIAGNYVMLAKKL